MLKNIKRAAIVISLTLCMLMGFTWSSTGSAAADSFSGTFACVDNTSGLTVTRDSRTHVVGLTCKSGADIDYQLNTAYTSVVSYSAGCPSGQTPGPTYPTSKTVILKCYSSNGGGENGGGNSATTSMPTFKQKDSLISCPDTKDLVAKKSDCPKSETSGSLNLGDANGKYKCGGGDGVHTTINIGCRGKGNAVTDMVFAIIRFLTTGVGLILVGSTIFAGIQYSSSRGDPQATAGAINRLRANAWALLLFLFGYAILNYIVPGALLK